MPRRQRLARRCARASRRCYWTRCWTCSRTNCEFLRHTTRRPPLPTAAASTRDGELPSNQTQGQMGVGVSALAALHTPRAPHHTDDSTASCPASIVVAPARTSPENVAPYPMMGRVSRLPSSQVGMGAERHTRAACIRMHLRRPYRSIPLPPTRLRPSGLGWPSAWL